MMTRTSNKTQGFHAAQRTLHSCEQNKAAQATTCGKLNELPAPNRLRGSVIKSWMSKETKTEGEQLSA
jgi:hypothetical protein